METKALVDEPYSAILGYPRCSAGELESRVRELQANGVSAFLFEGDSKLGKLDMLGKGCVSIVVKAIYYDQVIAVKIRRTDANRKTMEREGDLLKLANKANVGPRFIKVSKNFLLMGLAQGLNIFKFIESVHKRKKIVNLVSELLEQCYRLDRIGLDHGQLSYMNKHVIVGRAVTIIDFETGSINRRLSNVTSAAQYLFIGGAVAEKVRKLLGLPSTDLIISSLKQYKNDPCREKFERLKQDLHL